MYVSRLPADTAEYHNQLLFQHEVFYFFQLIKSLLEGAVAGHSLRGCSMNRVFVICIDRGFGNSLPVISASQVVRHSAYPLGKGGEAGGNNFSPRLTLNFLCGLPDRDSKNLRLEPSSPADCEWRQQYTLLQVHLPLNFINTFKKIRLVVAFLWSF